MLASSEEFRYAAFFSQFFSTSTSNFPRILTASKLKYPSPGNSIIWSLAESSFSTSTLCESGLDANFRSLMVSVRQLDGGQKAVLKGFVNTSPKPIPGCGRILVCASKVLTGGILIVCASPLFHLASLS